MPDRTLVSRIVAPVLVGAAYFVAGKLGLSLAIVNPSATAVWPPAGIALAAFIVIGPRVWPGVLLGAFLVNVTTAVTAATAAGIAIGNTLEGLVASALVRRFARGRSVFERPGDIFRFAGLAGGLATLVSATVGVTSLVLGGYAQPARIADIWLTWWLGDAAGILLLTPLLLLWSERPRTLWPLGRALELGLLLGILVAVAALVFASFSPLARQGYPLEFLCFPMLAWLAFRFTPRASATGMALLSAIAIWGTIDGYGPFRQVSSHESLLLLQAFLGLMSVLVLAVTASSVERGRNDAAIRRLNLELEDRVARRTGQLRDANAELRTQIAERLRAQGELQSSEARLREAQRVARIGSWEWDIDRDTVWWSDELYALYGLAPGSLEASYEGFLERVHPDDRDAVRRHVNEAVGAAAPFSFDHRIVRPDGTVLVLHAAGRVDTDATGRPIRMSGTGQDVTEHRNAEEHRIALIREQAARREAEEANRQKDEFLATLSHELRTPLTAILGWTDVLREGRLDEPARARAIETISRNARIQAQLISDILDSSRMSLGRLDLRKEPVEPAAVIESALETMKPAAFLKSIRLEADLAPGVGPVLGDSDRLQQVVWNLLSNAIKFAPEGGRVGIRLSATGSSACIRVEDDGPGIDAALLPHVFERFRKGDSSSTRQHGGLGLGLAIVRHLVELHGGSVLAANREGRCGAVVTVTLPLLEAPAPARVAPFAVPPPAGNGSGPVGLRGAASDATALSGLVVLVVEDDRDSREVIALLLSGSGAEVLAAASASEGFAILHARRPDVLISDIEMPGETGYDLISKVRALPEGEGGGTPAIALTAYAGTENAARAMRAGFQAHLAKPVQFDKLARIVAHVVSQPPRGR